jgi:hypothetical protein
LGFDVEYPMVPSFNNQQSANQADMVANATAMKLAALSTVNNRIALDDVRKYRRARSSDRQGNGNQLQVSPSFPSQNVPSTSVIMINETGQVLNTQQVSTQQLAALQAQQQAALAGGRSRRAPQV